jgi:cell division protein FtsQ
MKAAAPMPVDVKLMNAAATALFALAGFAMVAFAAWWALRQPLFAIGGITVQGEVLHNNAVTLRANVAPRLQGNFFTADLARAREAFESVPWVRTAIVRREFPNRLKVVLQEHKPVAYWGAESESKLLNSYGEVFEANVGEVDFDELPRLAGPDEQAGEVLAMFETLKPMFASIDMDIELLELTGRGGWRAQLDGGAEVELGRGTVEEVQARTLRFVRTLTQVASQNGRRADSLESADLRHGDGYALKLRGVTTVIPDAQKTKR